MSYRTCLTGPLRQLDVVAGLLAEALTAVIPATLAGNSDSASKRASERPNAGRRFIFPPSLNAIPTALWPRRRSFGESQMNVRLNRGADRCVLWQRNAPGSRCCPTSTPVAGAGGKGAIRRGTRFRRGLGFRPFHAALRRPERPVSGSVDPTGRAGGSDLPHCAG